MLSLVQMRARCEFSTQDEDGGIPHRILNRVREYSFMTVKQASYFKDSTPLRVTPSVRYYFAIEGWHL